MYYHFYHEDIMQKSIGELLSMLEAGTISSEELVWAYAERIAALDQAADGPQLGAVRELNPDAFQIARERDWERRTGVIRGPLHGIPILIKDTIDTGDKMHTTCGAAAFRDHRAEEDAFIVKKLREAGAIILGKNYCSELYGFNALEKPNGYSSLLGGSPKNPFLPDRLIPGGSSGGSAISVAADMAAASIGTETAGSIFEPAYVNGVVGYKPTVGLTSRTGILPIMMCQDTAGPLTRTVEDAARIADVIIARDEADPDTIRASVFEEGSFLDGLEEESLNGKRIGIVKEAYYANMGVTARSCTDRALDVFRLNGARIVEVENFLPAQILSSPNQHPERLGSEVMDRAFKVRFDHYLSRQKDLPFGSLKELIAWNKEHPECIPLGQGYLELIESLGDQAVMAPEFTAARMNDLDICGTRGIWGAMEHYRLDALILPGLDGQAIAATAGNPTITIPVGYGKETGPVGITLVGELMGDRELLRIARACEKLLPKRPLPEM